MSSQAAIAVALITQLGVIASTLLVLYAKHRMKLWERRGDESDNLERRYNALKPGYERLWEEYGYVLVQAMVLKQEFQQGNVEFKTKTAEFALLTIINRPLMHNVLDQIRREENEKRRSDDDGD